MAIDANQRKAMAPGTKLTAKYKKQEHTAEVIAGEEGKLLYRLADGREFKSPSAAGSAIMGGVACNGWRFWSIATDEAPEVPAETPAKNASTKRTAKRSSKKSAASAEPAAEVEQSETSEPGEDTQTD